MSVAFAGKLERDYTSHLENIHAGIKDLASGLGMEDESELHAQAHKRLAIGLQELAVMDAKMDMKVKATKKATMTLAQEMNRKRTNAQAAAAAEGEEVSMEHFLEQMSASVSAAMEGADESVLQSKRYKDLMKRVTTIQGEDDDDDDMIIDRDSKVSLICPLTSAVFKEPVKSQACNHTFEKGAILNHIKIAGTKKTLAACPVAGCTRKVTAENLVIDEAMLRRLRIESQTEQTGPAVDAEEIDDTVGETYI